MRIGNHENVFEYDGAFKCLGCKDSWGALPGNPEMPEACKFYPLSLHDQLTQVQFELLRCKQELTALKLAQESMGMEYRAMERLAELGVKAEKYVARLVGSPCELSESAQFILDIANASRELNHIRGGGE